MNVAERFTPGPIVIGDVPGLSVEPDDAALIEALAALEHEQWMAWAKNIAETEPGLSRHRLSRWEHLMVPYAALTEYEKEQDREWARKVLEVLRSDGR